MSQIIKKIGKATGKALGYLALASGILIGSGCATTTPKDVRDIKYIVQGIVEKSLDESVNENSRQSGKDLEGAIQEDIGNKIDSAEYGLHFEDFDWPRKDIPGIDSLDINTDKYHADVKIEGEKVFLEVTLPTTIEKNGKTYHFDKYKATQKLK